jgi:hypothetical protein
MPYRTHEGGPCETIVIPTQQPRWWALAFVAPLPLAFSSDFLNWLHPLPPKPVFGPEDWCGTANALREAPYATALREQQGVQSTIFFMALFGLVVAAASLLIRARTMVFIDRGARVLRVRTPNREWSATFAERPTLVEQRDAYWLYARELAPVAIAKRNAPPEPLDRLRTALSRLLAPESS